MIFAVLAAAAFRLPLLRREGGELAVPLQPAAARINGTHDEAVRATDWLTAALSTNATQVPTLHEDMCLIAAQYGAAPSLCPQGASRFSTAQLQAHVQGFATVWSAMVQMLPGVDCCMGINHRFALYVILKELKPQCVIESGAAAGHTTFLIRAVVGAGVPVFVMDPRDPASYANGIFGYRDVDPKTAYFVGPLFQDLAMVRWDQLIPDAGVRANTFVLLDDHQSSTKRLQMLRRWGFLNMFYEDNYPFNVATSADSMTCPSLQMARTYASVMHGDAYSPNTMCAEVPVGTTFVLYKDRFGKLCELLTMQQHQANVGFMEQALESYFEFPALYTSCASKRTALFPDVSALTALGLPTEAAEIWQYGHLYPPLMTLKPLEVGAQAAELAGAIKDAGDFAQRVALGTQVV